MCETECSLIVHKTAFRFTHGEMNNKDKTEHSQSNLLFHMRDQQAYSITALNSTNKFRYYYNTVAQLFYHNKRVMHRCYMITIFALRITE